MRKVIGALIFASLLIVGCGPTNNTPNNTESSPPAGTIIGPMDLIFTDCRETAPKIVCIVETDSGWEIRDGRGKTAKISEPNGDPNGYAITYPLCKEASEHNCVWLGGPDRKGKQYLDVNGIDFPVNF